METSEPSFVAETLAWCNEMRAAKGEPPLDELPKGRRGDPRSCPCGRATGMLVVNSYSAYLGQPLPSPVLKFVRAFDNGLLPQYDEAP